MTIPGRGDLAPPRHHSSTGRWLVALVVLAVLGGGGYAAYVELHGSSSGDATAGQKLARCPKPSTAGMFAAPHDVRVTILNASLQTGLAATLGGRLHRRGFHITSIGNALHVVHGVAAIRYSADQLRASRTLAAQIPGTVPATEVAGHGVLDFEPGLGFQQLRSGAAATTLERQRVAAATPTPTASPSDSCRPRQ